MAVYRWRYGGTIGGAGRASRQQAFNTIPIFAIETGNGIGVCAVDASANTRGFKRITVLFGIENGNPEKKRRTRREEQQKNERFAEFYVGHRPSFSSTHSQTYTAQPSRARRAAAEEAKHKEKKASTRSA